MPEMKQGGGDDYEKNLAVAIEKLQALGDANYRKQTERILTSLRAFQNAPHDKKSLALARHAETVYDGLATVREIERAAAQQAVLIAMNKAFENGLEGHPQRFRDFVVAEVAKFQGGGARGKTLDKSQG
jgi:Cys-tRNA synthase (O-phospho-L-seryl-tRNA:Cys-tRNA synthase)